MGYVIWRRFNYCVQVAGEYTASCQWNVVFLEKGLTEFNSTVF